MNSLTFKIIKKYLNDNSINIVSDSSDDEIFKNINSIDQAKNNELIFLISFITIPEDILLNSISLIKFCWNLSYSETLGATIFNK